MLFLPGARVNGPLPGCRPGRLALRSSTDARGVDYACDSGGVLAGSRAMRARMRRLQRRCRERRTACRWPTWASPRPWTLRRARPRSPFPSRRAGSRRYSQETEAAGYLCAWRPCATPRGTHTPPAFACPKQRRAPFEVADNGQGFDPAATQQGSGLQGMADRIDELGAHVNIDSGPGQGTKVSGQVPASAISRPSSRARPNSTDSSARRMSRSAWPLC